MVLSQNKLMPYLDIQLRQRLDTKLARLNKLRPLPPSSIAKLREKLAIEMTYNSNAIEGNRLSLRETYLVINEGLTIKGKSLRDHLEAKDHHEALSYLYDLVSHGKSHTLSEVFIRTIHQLVVQDVDREWAGKYRDGGVIITGADHKPPEAIEIPRLMREFILWIKENQRKIHPVELAAIAHHKLVYIHPFFDGNGRTARLIMNLILMQKGYPLAVILRNDRKKYYEVLHKSDRGDLSALIYFVTQAVERSLNIYLETLIPKGVNKELFIALSEISKKLPYSTKYLNLLARKGKIEAHKDKRNWLTSVEAVQRYMKNRLRKRNLQYSK